MAHDIDKDIACDKVNVRLFIMYCRGELTEAEKSIFDEHKGNCDNCSANFAYVQNILKGNEPLSVDEETQLLRYMCSGLWHDASFNIRNRTKKEMLEQFNFSSFVQENIKQIDKLPVLSIVRPKIESRKILLIGITLAIFLVSVLTAGYVFFVYSPNKNMLSVSSTKQISLYEQLNTAIDSYLIGESDEKKLNNIATAIEAKYGDLIGVEAIKLYKTATPAAKQKILTLRQETRGFLGYANGSEYINALGRLQELETEFLKLNDNIDALHVKGLIARALFLSSKASALSIINDGIKETAKYPSLQIQFQMWQAKGLLETDERHLGVTLLEEVAKKAKNMQLVEIRVSAVKSLSGVLHLEGRNEEALSLAQSVLSLSDDYRGKVTLLHICAGASAELKHVKLANAYAEQAIELANKHSDKVLLAFSYLWKGIVETENAQYYNAEISYREAKIITESLSAIETQNSLHVKILGYQAKNQLLAGNNEIAALRYDAAIKKVNKFEDKTQHTLELSQLHAGLGLALKKKQNKESLYHQQLAKEYGKSLPRNRLSLCMFNFAICS